MPVVFSLFEHAAPAQKRCELCLRVNSLQILFECLSNLQHSSVVVVMIALLQVYLINNVASGAVVPHPPLPQHPGYMPFGIPATGVPGRPDVPGVKGDAPCWLGNLYSCKNSGSKGVCHLLAHYLPSMMCCM